MRRRYKDCYLLGTVTATGSKLTTLPSWDPNYENIVANQGAVVVEQSGNTIQIKGILDNLESFESSAGAGTHKWIGIDIATNLDTIVGATWDGYEITEADEEEAEGLGLGAGHIVFWAAADSLADNARTVEIGTEDKGSVSITFEFVDER